MHIATQICTPKSEGMFLAMRYTFPSAKLFIYSTLKTHVRIAHPHAHSGGENVREADRESDGNHKTTSALLTIFLSHALICIFLPFFLLTSLRLKRSLWEEFWLCTVYVYTQAQEIIDKDLNEGCGKCDLSVHKYKINSAGNGAM